MDSTSPSTLPIPPAKKTNWWVIGCGGCFGVSVLGVLVFGAIFFFGVVKVLKSSEPYKTALAGATNSAEVQEALGTPITDGFMPTGSVNSNSSDGTTTETADLTISLKGPKASGSVHYAAKKTAADWEVSDFTVTVAGSDKKINLAQ